METINCIKNRRSIREFLNKKVEDEKLKTIIEAGLYAPCSKGIAPWHFIVIQGKTKNEIAKIMKKSIGDNEGPIDPEKLAVSEKIDKKIRVSVLASVKIVENAPAIILVFNKSPFTKSRDVLVEAIKKASPEMANSMIFTREVEISGVSAAVQNIMLRSTDEGLSSVWLADAGCAKNEIKEYFNLNHDLVAAIAVGYGTYHPGQKNPDWSNVNFLN
jgi:nitroreductase